jgi:hypothetical protein
VVVLAVVTRRRMGRTQGIPTVRTGRRVRTTESIIADATRGEIVVAGPPVTLRAVREGVVTELLSAVAALLCMPRAEHLRAVRTGVPIIRTGARTTG